MEDFTDPAVQAEWDQWQREHYEQVQLAEMKAKESSDA